MLPEQWYLWNSESMLNWSKLEKIVINNFEPVKIAEMKAVETQNKVSKQISKKTGWRYPIRHGYAYPTFTLPK